MSNEYRASVKDWRNRATLSNVGLNNAIADSVFKSIRDRSQPTGDSVASGSTNSERAQVFQFSSAEDREKALSHLRGLALPDIIDLLRSG